MLIGVHHSGCLKSYGIIYKDASIVHVHDDINAPQIRSVIFTYSNTKKIV
jgi:hypothetical protein